MSDRTRAWATFVRLWFVLAFSFALIRLLFDLIGPGYIDLRTPALLQLIVVPLGQAAVYWLITRGARRA